jgi:hypothetical protein
MTATISSTAGGSGGWRSIPARLEAVEWGAAARRVLVDVGRVRSEWGRCVSDGGRPVSVALDEAETKVVVFGEDRGELDRLGVEPAVLCGAERRHEVFVSEPLVGGAGKATTTDARLEVGVAVRAT